MKMKKKLLILLALLAAMAVVNGCSSLKKSDNKIAAPKNEKEIDSDGDGIPDYLDEEPNTPKGVKVDSRGRALDSDGDGIPDYLDEEPNTPKGVKVDSRGRALDSDGDGIPDYLDEEPNTPKGVKVDSRGRALDSDGDGIPDYLDEEPNTPKGVKVDSRGRALDSDGDGIPDYLDEEPNQAISKTVETKGSQELIILDTIKKNTAQLTPEMFSILDRVVEVLSKNKNMKIKITGHTCSIGTDEYNLKLSKRRAEAAEKYLLSKKVSKNRIEIDYKGESKPAVLNDNEENRSKNRRIEILFYNDKNKVKEKNKTNY
jgi:OmpA-OmpF porin, OOP family